jgi:TetR/AcrR family transcriptional regulator, transcriptional repressor for nem operon
MQNGSNAVKIPGAATLAKNLAFHIPFGILHPIERMSTFKPRSETTRQLIIEKTAMLFNKKGVEGTTLTDLTKATKLTKGSIYGNFQNKHEVAMEAFRFNFQQLVQRIYAFVIREKEPIKQLYAITKFYRSDFETMTYLGGCPLLNAASDADDTNGHLRKEVIKSFTAVIDTIAGLIHSGQQAGQIRKKVDAEKYSALFFELIEGGVLLSKTTGEKHYLITACERIDSIIKTELEI